MQRRAKMLSTNKTLAYLDQGLTRQHITRLFNQPSLNRAACFAHNKRLALQHARAKKAYAKCRRSPWQESTRTIVSSSLSLSHLEPSVTLHGSTTCVNRSTRRRPSEKKKKKTSSPKGGESLGSDVVTNSCGLAFLQVSFFFFLSFLALAPMPCLLLDPTTNRHTHNTHTHTHKNR